MKGLVILVIVFCVSLAGCSAIDGFLFKPARTQSGELVFEDVAASKAAGQPVLVPASERVPGREYAQVFSDESTGVPEVAGGLLGLIPGWGVVASGVVSLIGGLVMAARGRRRVNIADMKTGAYAMGLELIANIATAYARGDMDKDGDGKVSLAELKDYALNLAKDLGQPEFVRQVIEIFNAGLVPSERQKALEKALETLE